MSNLPEFEGETSSNFKKIVTLQGQRKKQLRKEF